jgi:phosphatidylserine/phosphatidylglycerophosphate/cardiolipin synthase-like enzyme
MAAPSITTPIATSQTSQCQINLPWFVQGTEYCPTSATFEPLVNGERAFGAVYDAILAATHSVEIICWGFQPSMYFKRGDTNTLCIGDLLVKKANEGVKVRILCWYDSLHMAQFSENPTPGDNVSNWSSGIGRQNRNDAQTEYDKMWYRQMRLSYTDTQTGYVEFRQNLLRQVAWGHDDSLKIENIQFVTRDFNLLERVEIAHRLHMEALDTGRSTTNKIKGGAIMFAWPSHHQKMVQVDYEKPEVAVGFVMGHNTLDAYWDDDKHSYARMHARFGRNGAMPRQDISSRVTGPVLEYLNHNFCEAWKKETGIDLLSARKPVAKELRVRPDHGVPLMAQVLRTQSQENIRDIEKLYLKAVNNTTKFIYIENQYFRWPPLAEKIKSVAQKLLDGGRDLEKDGPIYLFVVTNSSEEGLGPGSVNTFRMLKQLGRPELLPGVAKAERHDELVAELNAAKQEELLATRKAAAFNEIHGIDHDERTARIYEPLKNKMAEARVKVEELEKELPQKDAEIISPSEIPGLKVHICTLVAPDSPPDNWMDVYVHSKLMIIDDVFTTVGSANINTRSMQVDSELNICIEEPSVTKPLREHLFEVHAGDVTTGCDMSKIFEKWQDIIDENNDIRTNNSKKDKNVELVGPIASLIEFMQTSDARTNLD